MSRPKSVSSVRLRSRRRRSPAELLLELLDRPGQGPLRDIELLRRTSAIQGVGVRLGVNHLGLPGIVYCRSGSPTEAISLSRGFVRCKAVAAIRRQKRLHGC